MLLAFEIGALPAGSVAAGPGVRFERGAWDVATRRPGGRQVVLGVVIVVLVIVPKGLGFVLP